MRQGESKDSLLSRSMYIHTPGYLLIVLYVRVCVCRVSFRIIMKRKHKHSDVMSGGGERYA